MRDIVAIQVAPRAALFTFSVVRRTGQLRKRVSGNRSRSHGPAYRLRHRG
jgi:hypothetical protein